MKSNSFTTYDVDELLPDDKPTIWMSTALTKCQIIFKLTQPLIWRFVTSSNIEMLVCVIQGRWYIIQARNWHSWSRDRYNMIANMVQHSTVSPPQHYNLICYLSTYNILHFQLVLCLAWLEEEKIEVGKLNKWCANMQWLDRCLKSGV